MALTNRLTQTLDFQSQALVLRSERQKVLASNIANADTPGYVARDMDFNRALREATGHNATGHSAMGHSAMGHSATAASTLTTTAVPSSARHISGHIPLFGQSTLSYALASQNSIDRNTVDMDRERATFADNSVRYEAALRFINGGVRTMLDAMKSHNQ